MSCLQSVLLFPSFSSIFLLFFMILQIPFLYVVLRRPFLFLYMTLPSRILFLSSLQGVLLFPSFSSIFLLFMILQIPFFSLPSSRRETPIQNFIFRLFKVPYCSNNFREDLYYSWSYKFLLFMFFFTVLSFFSTWV